MRAREFVTVSVTLPFHLQQPGIRLGELRLDLLQPPLHAAVLSTKDTPVLLLTLLLPLVGRHQSQTCVRLGVRLAPALAVALALAGRLFVVGGFISEMCLSECR